MPSPRLSVRIAVVALSLLVPSLASAEPTAAELRDQLRAVREHPPANVPDGTLTSIEFLADLSERIEDRFSAQAPALRRRAARYLEAVRAGRDPYVEERGKITNRGYRSAASTILQGYAIYLPPGYDPSRSYPLYVALHGGSSNGNLFLGVVLGNNMDWLTYNQHLWDEFTPRWTPNWIVVAPTGYGQMLWRWQAEQDVLDVIADVQRHYNVDPNQVVLGGLSNGGLGAYAIGMRHAWRFSTVMAMAGAPSWLQYAPCDCRGLDRANIERYSGMHLTENSFNTDWRSYHGRVDPGPMRPAFVAAFEERVHELGLPARITWYEDTGHDILYIAHVHGTIYDRLAPTKRNPHPSEVRVVTGDYRAARQHWVTVTRITDYPRLARVRAVANGDTITVETSNTTAFSLDLRDAPATGDDLRVVVDGAEAYRGPKASLGHVASFVKGENGFRTGFPEDPEGALVKRPGLAGPINDAYYGRMIHVYGTQDAEATEDLRRAAERGARGWVLWAWDLRQEVVADRDLTDAMLRDAHVVLYGTAGSNAVLERIADRLPIRIERDAIAVGAQRYTGPDVGVRFIYPSPLAEGRYVIVQGGVTKEAVLAGNNIPEFLPDWFVYNRQTVRSAQQSRTAGGRAPALASGFFDERWQLRAGTAALAPVEREELFGPLPALDPEESAERALATAVNELAALDGEAIDWRAVFRANALPPARRDLPFLPLMDEIRGGDPSEGGGVRGRIRSRLPIPPAPPIPPLPASFLVADTTPEGRAARMIAQRVQSFFNYRARIAGATWTSDPGRVWQIRPSAQCLADLDRAGVPYRVAENASELVPTGVYVGGPVNGVRFQMAAANRPFLVACELAARLPETAEILRRDGITTVGVVSAYRDNPYTSFHTMGLALDIGAFHQGDTVLRVVSDFVMTPDLETCSAPDPANPKARTLLHVACDLARSHVWSSVLTPNYNEGHRDHFHVDVRPDDPRFFVR